MHYSITADWVTTRAHRCHSISVTKGRPSLIRHCSSYLFRGVSASHLARFIPGSFEQADIDTVTIRVMTHSGIQQVLWRATIVTVGKLDQVSSVRIQWRCKADRYRPTRAYWRNTTWSENTTYRYRSYPFSRLHKRQIEYAWYRYKITNRSWTKTAQLASHFDQEFGTILTYVEYKYTPSKQNAI
jgi:hypothetical protein